MMKYELKGNAKEFITALTFAVTETLRFKHFETKKIFLQKPRT